MLNSQNNHWLSLSPQDVPINEKNHSTYSTSWCLGRSLALPQAKHRGLHQVPGGGSCCCPGLRKWCWKTPCLATGLCTIPHKQENSVLTVRKFLWLHQSYNLTTKLPRLQSPWLLCVEHSWVKEPIKLYTIPKRNWGKDNSGIYQSKLGDYWKGLQEFLKSSGGHVWSKWQFLCINLSNNILRYFLVILLNISEKVICQHYFHFCVI